LPTALAKKRAGFGTQYHHDKSSGDGDGGVIHGPANAVHPVPDIA